ncbi:MAG: undecaprenyl/decaprenyl-phosphate alpha-N-acetylglucosaminyl 1-phosphate transferase [Elusimicrobia bacterium]|nr:undecaprenyl/decaprenyl-phosphate alpha-N-acetylglucosaminyl 1-phosphate transferase [Elusimicrobiota bacterium]
MITNNYTLYLTAFGLSTTVAFFSAPLFRWIALRLNIMDHPNSPVKTHVRSTPYLGGCAIALAFIVSLTAVRYLSISSYPPGTLRPIQGIFFGGFLIFLLGLVDDTVSGGLSFQEKFLIQFIASAVLLFYGIQIHFVHPRWLAFALTLIWVTGVVNAVNIIDIMDGLASGCATIAALAFLFISLPTEHIYVNVTAATLAGACLGFLPYNFSKAAFSSAMCLLLCP